MKREELRKKIFAKINNLPTLPVVIPKLLRLLDDKETRAEQVVDTVSHDPALASKILQVANSAYYGFPQKISSLERAIALLGFNMVKSLALSIGVIRALPERGKGHPFSHEDLWIHSLAVATLMRHIGRRFKASREEADSLFIIGLLHDVGKIVLDQFFPQEFLKVLERVGRDSNVPFYEAELEAIGIEHGETGALLLTRWKFPDIIILPIRLHHRRPVEKEGGKLDWALLRISDSLAQRVGVGSGGNPVPPPILEEERAFLKLDGQGGELDAWTTFLEGAREGIYDFYRAMR